MANGSIGYIKVYRSLMGHWLWQDGNEKKLKWWLSVLLEVNHSDQKINLGYELHECKRGQSIKSLGSWAKDWRVSKDTVRNFFVLLKNEEMIITENIGSSTRLTVCNYESYQDSLHSDNFILRKTYAKSTPLTNNESDSCDDNLHVEQTQSKRDTYTNNNDKNVKNELVARQRKFYESVAEFKDQYPKEMLRAFYDYWSELNKSGKKMRWELQTTFEVVKRLATWASRDKNFDKRNGHQLETDRYNFSTHGIPGRNEAHD